MSYKSSDANVNVTVQERFTEAGCYRKPFAEFEFPDMQYAELPDGREIPYKVYGGVAAAKGVIFTTIPYSTRLADESIDVRLATQQIAVGNEYAVVGVQVYAPHEQPLDHKERKMIAAHSFRPLSDRVLAVMQAVNPRSDQTIGIYGFSLGGDVSVELTYQSLFDENRGIYVINTLGAIECARSANRGRIAVAQAFASSGDDLFDNVIDSRMPALNEARQIDPAHTYTKAKSRHEHQVVRGVAAYNLRDPLGNMALISGFGSDFSKQQILTIHASRSTPYILTGRAEDSLVCVPEFIEELPQDDSKLELVTLRGDHSIADNLQVSGRLMLKTALLGQ